jgi:hypothetical protein
MHTIRNIYLWRGTEYSLTPFSYRVIAYTKGASVWTRNVLFSLTNDPAIIVQAISVDINLNKQEFTSINIIR